MTNSLKVIYRQTQVELLHGWQCDCKPTATMQHQRTRCRPLKAAVLTQTSCSGGLHTSTALSTCAINAARFNQRHRSKRSYHHQMLTHQRLKHMQHYRPPGTNNTLRPEREGRAQARRTLWPHHLFSSFTLLFPSPLPCPLRRLSFTGQSLAM